MIQKNRNPKMILTKFNKKFFVLYHKLYKFIIICGMIKSDNYNKGGIKMGFRYGKIFSIVGLSILIYAQPIFAQPKTIQYGVELGYPPFKYEQNGQLEGFELDLSALIFYDNRYDVQYSYEPWEKVYEGVKDGMLDTCGMTVILKERQEDVLFTDPVYQSGVAIYTNKSFPRVSMDSLQQYRIAVGKEHFTEELLNDELGVHKYFVYKTIEGALEALKKGEVDILFENQQVVNYLLSKEDLKGSIIPQHMNLFPVEVAYAVSKDNPQLVEYMNRRIKHLKRKGLYEELYQKYFYTHSQYYQQALQVKIIITIGIIALIVIGIFVIQRMNIKYLNHKVKEEQSFLGKILDHAGILIIVWDFERTIIRINKFTEKITGFMEKEVVGNKLEGFFVRKEDKAAVQKLIHQLKDNASVVTQERKAVTRKKEELDILWNNSVVCDKNGKPIYIISMGVDITEQKRNQSDLQRSYQELEETYEELAAAEEELKHQFHQLQDKQKTIEWMAFHDSLTGLPNRAYFEKKAEKTIEKSKEEKLMCGFIVLDLDNFKTINDIYGHSTGDGLLKQIGQWFAENFDKEILIARFGGDEFVLLVPYLRNKEEIYPAIDDIIKKVNEPWEVEGKVLYNTMSIGAAFYPDDGENMPQLFKRADAAMYKAKEQGKNKYMFYEPAIHEVFLNKLELETDLRAAVALGEFEIYYQPQYNLHTGEIIGAEALLRWIHPIKGMISPADFIPVAEETGLILEIDRWVMVHTCEQISEWKEEEWFSGSIAVNLSSQFVQNQNLPDIIEGYLEEYALEPQFLQIEITETIAMRNIEVAIMNLQKIQKMGVKVALDDFGTGFSSLNYLMRLPIDIIKIDKSFVHDITAYKQEAAIAETLILLAHKIHLKVLAEGIETKEQYNFMMNKKCDMVQGFLFSKPVPRADFEELLKGERRGKKEKPVR